MSLAPAAGMRFVVGSLASLLAACSFGSGGGGTGTYPGFPGAGESGADPLPGGQMVCYYGTDPTLPAATIEHSLEVLGGTEAVRVRLTLDPAFVDNTYGATAIGWGDGAAGGPMGMGGKRGHTFKDLVGSDHAELVFGGSSYAFRSDYISESDGAASGYATLGVLGGDGKMITGDASSVLAASTSLDRNLNERGYGAFVVDSPITDDAWSPSPEAPDWDFRVVYEVWVASAAVGEQPEVSLESIHASPSKADDNTVVVEPRPCPDDWGCQDPDGCGDGAGEDDGRGECQDPDGCGGGGEPVE